MVGTHGHGGHGGHGGQPNYLHRSGDERHGQHKDDYAHDVPHLTGSHKEAHYTPVPNPSHGKSKYEDLTWRSHHKRGETMKEHMQKRKMTDVHCCCFFVIFTIIFMSITQYAWTKGDPRRLYHGFDYEGRLCGVDKGVEQKPMSYWPNPDHLDEPICVEECPEDDIHQVPFPKESVEETKGQNYEKMEILRQTEQVSTYPSREMAGRFCLPTGGQSKLADLTRKIVGEEDGEEGGKFSILATLADSFKDITNAWSVLLLVLPVACIVCYAYIFMLRACAKVLIINFFFIIIAVSIGIAFYCLIYVGWNLKRAEEVAGQYTDHPRWITGGLGWFAVLVAIGSWISIWVVWPVIDKSANAIQAACETMWEVQLMLSMPMLEIGAKASFGLLWMWNFSFVLTNGDITPSSMWVDGKPVHGLVSKFAYTGVQTSHIIFYILGLMWTLEVITMVFKFMISWVMAHWYFEPCREDMSKKEATMDMWKAGLKTAFLSHFGSLAYCGLLMTIFAIYRPIDALLDYAIRQSRTSENPLAKAFEYACSCCTKCVQEVSNSVSKTAMVEFVLRGDLDFNHAARLAYEVLGHADKEIAVLHGLTTIYHMMGVLFTSAVGACMTFVVTGNISIFTSRSSQYYLESRIGICVAAFIVSFTVSMVFMYTLEMVSDSLLYCWLVEGEDDRTHTLYAPKHLRNLVFEDMLPKNKRHHQSLFAKDKHKDSGWKDREMDSGLTHSRHDDDMRSEGGWSNSSYLTSSHLTRGAPRHDDAHRKRDDRDHGSGWLP